MNTHLADRLRKLRGDSPQTTFAEQLAINKSSWGRYERGESEPTGSDLAKICSVCEVEPRWLLCGEGPMRHAEATPSLAGAEPSCARCRRLEERLEILERELCSQNAELRSVNAEHRRLWQQHSDLRDLHARSTLPYTPITTLNEISGSFPHE